jgi:hypothetical protein
MNGKPQLPGNSPISITVIAALAVVVAAGLLTAVTVMFQNAGTPYAQVVAAERACADRAYVSEREHCMQEWLAARERVAAGH